MKKTFEIKGVDLTELYGIGDQNILFLEKSRVFERGDASSCLWCLVVSRPSHSEDTRLPTVDPTPYDK